MLILALDSAGSGCAACVWKDGQVLAQGEEKMERGQDSRLLPLVQEIMAKAGLSYAELDRIAATRGPGSFTGLRIGLAAARGLGLAAGKPVIGIDRFSIHRAQRKESKELLVLLESRRLELYTRFYPVSGVAHEPELLPPEEIEKFLAQHPGLEIAGDVSAFSASSLESEVITCAALAALADPEEAAFLPRPLYLRAPDVTIACEGKV